MIIQIEKISFYSLTYSKLLFTVSNTKQKEFAIHRDTRVMLNGIDSVLIEVLKFLQNHNKVIAEIEFKEGDNYALKSINVMALE